MGVYIEGMDMPTTCMACPCEYDGACNLTSEPVDYSSKIRREDCPLIEEDDRSKPLMQAIASFGLDAQIIVMFEEMAELQKALTKWLRSHGVECWQYEDNIREEIADVQIMLDQMKMSFDTEDAESKSIRDWEKEKLNRLIERSNEEVEARKAALKMMNE